MRYQLNQFDIDTTQFTIHKDGQPLSIEPKVFDLIVFLIENRTRLVSRQELFEKVWHGREVSDTTLSNHIKSARKILDDNGELQKIIKTHRGRGYQFVAQIKSSSKPVKIQPKLSRFHRGIYQSVVALVLVLVVLALLIELPLYESKAKPHTRIAVLPFNNIKPAADTDYLGFAIADQIIGSLTNLNHLTVRASGSIRHYQQHNIDPLVIGNSLGVDFILLGSYLKEATDIRLNIELIEVSSNNLLWRESIEANFNSVFNLQDKVAKRVAEKLDVQFSPLELGHINDIVPASPLAYEYYLRAIAYPNTNQGAKLAVEMLLKAIALDPNYAASYVELGARTHFLGIFNLGGAEATEQAINYYLHALKLNPKSSRALAGLAKIYAEVGKTAKAVELNRKLIKLNPNDANAHFSLGYGYRYAGMLDQAIDAINKAISIEPNDRWLHNLGVTHTFKREYSQALKALKSGKPTPYALGWIASIYLHIGDKQKANDYLDRIITMEPGSFWELDSTGFKSVINEDFETGLKAVNQLEAAMINDGEAVFYWGALYAMLGDKKACLRMLNRAVDLGYFNYYLMKHESFLDSVRSEPEFKALLQLVKQKHLAFKEKYF